MLANHLVHEFGESRRELPGRLVPPLLREAGIATYVGKEKSPDGRLGRPGARRKLRLESGDGSTRSGGELAAARVALVRLLGQGTGDDVVELLRQLGLPVHEARRRYGEMSMDHRKLVLSLERRRPGEGLVQHAAERVDIRAPVNRTALDLLGSDVIDRADDRALAGQAHCGGGMPR